MAITYDDLLAMIDDVIFPRSTSNPDPENFQQHHTIPHSITQRSFATKLLWALNQYSDSDGPADRIGHNVIGDRRSGRIGFGRRVVSTGCSNVRFWHLSSHSAQSSDVSCWR